MANSSRGAGHRILYVTDIEGNMRYFQNCVAASAVLKWAPKKHQQSPSPAASQRSCTPPVPLEYADLDAFALAFQDETSQFVYGGDAFDHGEDLTFSRALLDFKGRHPDRVHLILGNRDVNKMVMKHIFRMAEEGKTVAPEEAEEALFPTSSGGPAPTITYAAYLEKERQQQLEESKANGTTSAAAVKSPVVFTPVSFLKWALIHRLGSPRAFELRRGELHKLKQRRAAQGMETPPNCKETNESSHPVAPLPTDEEVSESYAAAVQPGGAYYEYLKHGQLSHHVGNVLFVHGGITDDNIGVIPSPDAPYDDPLKSSQRISPEEGWDLPSWLRSLAAFKDKSFEDWRVWSGNKGEALRRYGNHCVCTKYSIIVNSLISAPNGPSFFSLPVVQCLTMSGVDVVCTGHMPTGDTPAIMRHPPYGFGASGLTCIAADNSYCGRGNAFSTADNPRGKAVSEVVLTMEGNEEEGSGEGASDAADALITCVDAHIYGAQADGTPFDFHVNSDDALLGRCLYKQVPSSSGSGEPSWECWWVKRKTADGKYALHCTTNSYYSEKEELYTPEDLEIALQAPLQTVSGELKSTHTAESLKNPPPVHRIKTKVSH